MVRIEIVATQSPEDLAYRPARGEVAQKRDREVVPQQLRRLDFGANKPTRAALLDKEGHEPIVVERLLAGALAGVYKDKWPVRQRGDRQIAQIRQAQQRRRAEVQRRVVGELRQGRLVIATCPARCRTIRRLDRLGAALPIAVTIEV